MIYRRVKPNDDDDVVDIHQWSYFPKVELSYIGFFYHIWKFTEFFRKYDNLQKVSIFWQFQYDKYFENFQNMWICNMTYFFIFRNITILIFLQFWDAWIYIAFSIIQNFSPWNLLYLKYDNLNMTIFLKMLNYDNQ